jgi:macrolide transport system ATP-binding/permease protein
MGTFLRDLRFGARQLIERPVFAAAAIGSLSLGIGLNVAIFSVVNAVLLRGQPLQRPDRLVEIYSGLSQDYPQLTTSYPDFQDIARSVDALAGVAGSSYVRGIISSGGRGSLITGETVTANYFELLGIPLELGRSFRPDENVTPNASPVIVASYGLWQRTLGGSPNAIGQTVKISGIDYTVIGVASREFTGNLPGIAADFWVPLVMVDRLVFSGMQASTDNDPGTTRLTRRGNRWLLVKGRLKGDHTLEQARAQIETLYARLRADYPNTNKDVTASVVPATSVRFHPMLDGYFQAASGGLFAAVGLVLLIACGNVAGLLLARASARRREFAIRAAIGASRRRLIQQLLSEGVILAGAGGTGGVAIAWWTTRALQGLAATDVFPIRVVFDFSIDGAVLLFAVAASAFTAVVFGLAPAWSASKPVLVPALRASAEGDERSRLSMRDILVIGQLAISMVLLVVGALLARGLLVARATDLGYDPQPLSSITFNLGMNGYNDARAGAFRIRALDTLRGLPGVTAVSTASRLPLAPDINMEGVKVRGHHAATDQDTPIDTVSVGIDYFATVGVPIVEGRAFRADDRGRRLAIVNETFARRYWPNESAVGQQIFTNGYDDPPREIVGVARDHKVRSVGEPPRPYLHVPDIPGSDGGDVSVGLVVRTSTPAAQALPMLRKALWSIEPSIVFTEDVPAEQIAATTMLPTRIGATVLGAFGAVALVLAAIGLYGVVAYSVSRRTREVGIRMALGAQRGEILRTMAARGARLAIAGLVIGALLATVAGSLLESMLYGVSAVDAIAFAAAAVVMVGVAALANLIPAAGATRIDPVRALRSE